MCQNHNLIIFEGFFLGDATIRHVAACSGLAKDNGSATMKASD